MSEHHDPAPDTSGRLRMLKQRHAAYYIDQAQQASQQYYSGGEGVIAGLTCFDQERAQLDAARAWLQAEPPDEMLDALLLADAEATAYIGDLRYSLSNERIPQLQHALRAAQKQGDLSAQQRFIGNLGLAYGSVGQHHRAIEFYQQLLVTARLSDQRHFEGITLANLGMAYYWLGQLRQAIDCYEQSLSIARETGSRRNEGKVLGHLGLTYETQGETRRALSCYEQHLAIAREEGDRRGEGEALGNLGNASAALGDLRGALELYEQSLAITREVGDRRGEGTTLGNLGSAYFKLEDAHKAIDYYQQSLAIAQEQGDRHGEARALGNLGNALVVIGEARRAIGYCEQHLAIAREIGDRRGEGNALAILGNAFVVLGEARRALSYCEQHLAIMREAGDRRGEGTALVGLATTYAALGRTQHAVEYYKQALSFTQAAHDIQVSAAIQWHLGGLLAKQGDIAAALSHLEQSLAFHQTINHPRITEMADIVATIRSFSQLTTDRASSDIQSPEKLLALLPESVRAALNQQDGQMLQRAIATLSSKDQLTTLQVLIQLMAQTEAGPQQIDLQKIFARVSRAPDRTLFNQKHSTPTSDMPRNPEAEHLGHTQPTQTPRSPSAATLHSRAGEQPAQTPPIMPAVPGLDQEQQLFLPVLGDIALAAHGDETARALAETHLPSLEARGWRLTDPVRRIWAGQRDEEALTAGLDTQDRALVQRILKLVADGPALIVVAESLTFAHFRQQVDTIFAQAQHASPTQRAAQAQDFIESAERLAERPGKPPAELAAHLRLLAQRLTSGEPTPQGAGSGERSSDFGVAHSSAVVTTSPDRPRTPTDHQHSQDTSTSAPDPNADPVVNDFLPLLGDIALAAHGNAAARAMAEARLLWLEQHGCRLTELARRVWAGEHDPAALCAGLDVQASVLAPHIVMLVGRGPSAVTVAESLQIVHDRHRADTAFAEAQRAGAEQRATQAQQFILWSEQVAYLPGELWADLAAHLRTLAHRLIADR